MTAQDQMDSLLRSKIAKKINTCPFSPVSLILIQAIEIKRL